MRELKFEVETKMEKEDYRAFLYYATFFRNKLIIPLIAVLAIMASLVIQLTGNGFSWTGLIISAVVFFALSIGVVIFKVERRNNQRVKNDTTGIFGATKHFLFYGDKLVLQTTEPVSKFELEYDQFRACLESKNYIIFYLSQNEATFIRKKDIQNLEELRKFLKQVLGEKFK